MRRPILYVPLFVMSFLFLAFGQNLSRIGEPFSMAEWAIIDTLSPLPGLPVDTTNKYRDSSDAALLGQKLFFEPRLSGPIQTGTPQEGQLGNIGDKYKIACRNCHMPESKWLFDIRSNNGGPIPNATALGSLWMTRNVSSIVNTVFYIHLLYPSAFRRALAGKRRLFRLRVVRCPNRARGSACSKRQPAPTGPRHLRALLRRLQQRVSELATHSRA